MDYLASEADVEQLQTAVHCPTHGHNNQVVYRPTKLTLLLLTDSGLLLDDTNMEK